MEIKCADNMLSFSQLLLLQSWSLHMDHVELHKRSYVPLNGVFWLLFFLLILQPEFQHANHEGWSVVHVSLLKPAIPAREISQPDLPLQLQVQWCAMPSSWLTWENQIRLQPEYPNAPTWGQAGL